MVKDQIQAHAVIKALRQFQSSIDEILVLLEGKRSVSREEKERLQMLLTSLKSKLKATAKLSPANEYEKEYFSPTATKAAANLTVAVNSHPINSNWYSCLYGVRIDINFTLANLEQQFPAQ